MQYHVVHHTENAFLSEHVDLVYRLQNTQNTPQYYKTVTNGIIGLGIILKGSAFIDVNGQWELIPRFSIFGMGEKPYHIKLSADYEEISIGFKPYAFNFFVNTQQRYFTKGRITDASLLYPGHTLEELAEALSKSKNDPDILSALDGFFQKQFNRNRSDHRVRAATQWIYENDIIRVQDIAQKLDISSVTLRNLFDEHVGVTPKELIKITRTHNVLKQCAFFKENLTELGYEFGYFDQSHFIKEFKSVMGITPKAYFRNEQLAFDFYNYGRWLTDNFTE
ncbi:MAG: AraC family transcriptional regulator [Bacteroidota bacterium]